MKAQVSHRHNVVLGVFRQLLKARKSNDWRGSSSWTTPWPLAFPSSSIAARRMARSTACTRLAAHFRSCQTSIPRRSPPVSVDVSPLSSSLSGRQTRFEDLNTIEQHLRHCKRANALATILVGKLLEGDVEELPDLTDAEAVMEKCPEPCKIGLGPKKD